MLQAGVNVEGKHRLRQQQARRTKVTEPVSCDSAPVIY
jgi:hypothetical protein